MLDTGKLTKQVYIWLSGIDGLTVTLEMPEKSMPFPVAVITSPIERGYPHEQHYDLQINVEAWNDTRYSVMRTFDKIKETMALNDIGLRNSTTIYQDPIIKKYRITGSFECRYNCITKTIEPNF